MRWLIGIAVLLVVTGCSGQSTDIAGSSAQAAESATPAPGASVESAVEPTSTAAASPQAVVAESAAPVCQAGAPRAGIESQLDAIRPAYNLYDSEALIAILGDGPVRDPSLEPGGTGEYDSIAAWMHAAETIGDRLGGTSYGLSEPVALFTSRSNDVMGNNGIDTVSLMFELWVDQDCETRVTTTNATAAPDPCRFFVVFETEAPSECHGAFSPRHSHLSAWTGDELLIYGGASGTHGNADLATGIAYDPQHGVWRDLAPSPLVLSSFQGTSGYWTGEELVVFGQAANEDEARVVIQAYDPRTDTWRVAAAPPEDMHLGGTAWTGEELVIVGGDHTGKDDRAWAYRPGTDQWRQLPTPGIQKADRMAGIWTGSEAIFIDGYSDDGGAPEAAAYNPATDTWREVTPPPIQQSVADFELVWTGQVVLAAWAHAGPNQPSALAIYDPARDVWDLSAPAPIPAADEFGYAWTGSELILWGGLGTYRTPDDDGDSVYGSGAAYDPAADTWRVLPTSPLTDRCAHRGTWTGSAFVVFGGIHACDEPGALAESTAASYDPVADAWIEIPPPGIRGVLPNGQGYFVESNPALSDLEAGISAGILMDFEDSDQRVVGNVLGIATFGRVNSSTRTTATGNRVQVVSGRWVLTIDIYDDVATKLGDDAADQVLAMIVARPAQPGSDLPSFTLKPPLRWASDEDLPLHMLVQYPDFGVRRGCSEQAVACTADGQLEVVPREVLFAPSQPWPGNEVTIIASGSESPPVRCDASAADADRQVVDAFLLAYNTRNRVALAELAPVDEIWDLAGVPHLDQPTWINVVAWAEKGWEVDDHLELIDFTPYGPAEGSDIVVRRTNQVLAAAGVDAFEFSFKVPSEGCVIERLIGGMHLRSEEPGHCEFYQAFGDKILAVAPTLTDPAC